MKKLKLDISAPAYAPPQARVEENMSPALRAARDFVATWMKGPHISFSGHAAPAMAARITASLELIATTSIGMELLAALESVALLKNERVTIIPDSHSLGVVPVVSANASNAVGTSSELFCNLDAAAVTRGNLDTLQFDSCVLFHELVHVYHNFLGEQTVVVPSEGVDASHNLLYEEARTVGLGRFRDELLSENAFRTELGIERRVRYAHENAIIEDDDTVLKGFSKEYLFP